jgi:hypothetical protein
MHLLKLLSSTSLVTIMCSTSVYSQNLQPSMQRPSPVLVTSPNAQPEDVQSIDGIVAALYDVISGSIGQARNWNRMRSLFIPEARIMAIFPKRNSSDLGLRIMSVSDYIANSGPFLIETGFREKELGRKTEQWGELAHVLTSYETITEKDGAVKRGINSVQLMNDGGRWWIVSLLFEAEREQLRLPEIYLKVSK